jgi:hypothetical protein
VITPCAVPDSNLRRAVFRTGARKILTRKWDDRCLVSCILARARREIVAACLPGVVQRPGGTKLATQYLVGAPQRTSVMVRLADISPAVPVFLGLTPGADPMA